MADRIVAMKDGVAQQIGPPAELYADPANIFVAGFIGSPAMNLLPATLQRDGDRASLQLGAVSLTQLAAPPKIADGSAVTLGLRPEQLYIAPAGEGVAARVDLVEPIGLGQVIYLVVADQRIKIFTTQSRLLSVGDQVGLKIDPKNTLLFDPANGKRLRPEQA